VVFRAVKGALCALVVGESATQHSWRVRGVVSRAVPSQCAGVVYTIIRLFLVVSSCFAECKVTVGQAAVVMLAALMRWQHSSTSSLALPIMMIPRTTPEML
jgi:hypothetical protein